MDLRDYLDGGEEYDLTAEQQEFSYTYDAWLEAFTIFKKYAHNGRVLGDITAEHDQVFAGPDGEEEIANMDDEDKERLLQLGWSFDNEIYRFWMDL